MSEGPKKGQGPGVRGQKNTFIASRSEGVPGTRHPASGTQPGVFHPQPPSLGSITRKQVPAIFFCLLFLFLFAAPRAHALWPIWWHLGEETNFLGPIASYEQKDGQDGVTVRPFLFSYTSGDKGECLFPYPLGKWSEEKSYFVPFFLRTKSEDGSAFSLLLFFYGKAQEKHYGGLFPLYGSLYNRFGEDEIHFYGWPLYTSLSGHGATRKDVLWPFFSFYGGDQSGFKAWPIFGTQGHKKGDRKSFFLWPVFFKIDRDMDIGEPKHSFWAFPFYMQTKAPTYEQYSFLWPFFGYYRSDEEKRVSLLYPLFSTTRGEEEQGTTFFPFYSYARTKESSNFYVLWPLYRESERVAGEKRWMERRVLLFGSKYLEDDRGTFFNVWPFFEYRGGEEQTSFFFPSILPIRDKSFDRIVRPLITLYEYERKGESRTTNLLYGLYTKDETGDSWKRRFAFLFEIKKESGGIGMELLSGLLGFDSRQFKVLFIPIRRDQSHTAQEDAIK